MRIQAILGALLLATSASLARAETDMGAAFITVPGKVAVVGQVKLSAEIIAIDAATRTLTVKTAQGERNIVAGPEVRNYEQIKVGDQVVVQAVESLTLELKKGGAGIRERSDASNTVRAEAGDKPGVASGTMTTVIADVVKVDRKSGIVSLKGVKRTLKLKVQDPEQLKLIEVGDQVKGRYVEALALGVTAQAAKPASSSK